MEKPLPFHQQLKHERTQRGWSQADLAEKLHTDTKTVGRWERGESRPQPFYRQKLLELFEKKAAEEFGLTADKEEDLILPSQQQYPLLEDWGEAPQTVEFYGREREIARLKQWIGPSQCRIVAILGMGGVGKTALCARVAEQMKDSFAYVFWRSLQNAPAVEYVLKQCLSLFSSQLRADVPLAADEQITLLMHYLRQYRCLLVLDNYESILQSGQRTGHCREGYEGYGRLLQRIGETQHQSCLLLTSREKPKEVAPLTGKTSPVQLFHLLGVEEAAGLQILQEKDLPVNDKKWADLIHLYSGNPLALKLVSESIQEIFGGDIARFLAEEELAFGDIDDLLQQQFYRLSELEREILYWLAIEREPVTLEAVHENLVHPVEKGAWLEAFNSLRRRSMIEARVTKQFTFTLQPVIMEYVTTDLVRHASEQFDTGPDTGLIGVWRNYALMKAQSKDYVRNSQVRLILAPIAQRLLDVLGKEGIELKVKRMLSLLSHEPSFKSGYAVGNVLNLLLSIQCDLRGYNFSRLLVWQAHLQNAILPQVNFSHALFRATIFTNTFGNILSVAYSPQGQLLATGTASGEIWIYRVADGRPLVVCHGHSDGVWSLAFSHADGTLASSSDDQTVRLWDVATGACLSTLHGHSNRVRAIAFHPDGYILASGSDDATVRLWDVATGRCLNTLHGHSNRVWSVAFNPGGNLLATGSTDQTIRLWNVSTGQCTSILQGHENWIRSVVFHPAGQMLASSSDDQTLRLWDVNTGQCLETLRGHSSRVWSVAFNPGGDILASGSEDRTIRLWKTGASQCFKVLQEHTHGVRAVSFSPDGLTLASGGDDQTARLWDISTGQCVQTLQGYTNRIWAISFHPNGTFIASCGEDSLIRLWDVQTGRCIKTFQESVHGPRAIAFCSDGQTLASGGEDAMVHLWNIHTGERVKTLSGHTNWVRSVAFHPNGFLLASGGEDLTIRLWDTNTGICLNSLEEHSSWVRSLAFNADGSLLASSGDDQVVRLWDASTGQCLSRLEGHSGRVRSVAFHPRLPLLASGSEDQTIRLCQSETGACLNVLHGHTNWVRSVALSPSMDVLASSGDDSTIRLWDSNTGRCLHVLAGHVNRVRCVTFDPTGATLASCSDDGTIRCWNMQTFACDKLLISERPYEGMNITKAAGLSEAQKGALRALGAVEDE